MIVKTRWILERYDPSKIVTEPALPRGDCELHMVYAAMLDGVLGGKRLSEITGLGFTILHRGLRTLEQYGYVKKAVVGSIEMFVPVVFTEGDL